MTLPESTADTQRPGGRPPVGERAAPPAGLDTRRPAMLLLAWLDGGGEIAAPDEPLAAHRLEGSLYGLLAEPGDPAVCEAAYTAGRRLLDAQPPGAFVRAAVLPGVLIDRNGELSVAPDPLLDELLHRPPRLDPGVVHLTGHALSELEGPWASSPAHEWRRPSGRVLPLHRLDRPSTDRRVWRNPQLFHRAVATVERPEAEDLEAALAEPAVWIEGPIGCGKTRAAHHALRDRPVAYARCWSARSGGPALAPQLLHALAAMDPGDDSTPPRWPAARGGDGEHERRLIGLLEGGHAGPVHLMLDDLEAARPEDLALVERLLALESLGESVRLALVGRPHGPAAHLCRPLPRVGLGALPGDESELVWQQLAEGLSIPPEVDRRLQRAGGGLPFALEEGLIELVRRRFLRQLYGNYFYSGPPDVDFMPTPRLVRHVEAEAGRLGAGLALRILATGGAELPLDLIPVVCRELGRPLGPDWAAGPREGGLLTSPSETADEARLLAPAIQLCLAEGLAADARTAVRSAIADALTRATPGAPPTWERYQLLAETPEAVPLILKLAGSQQRIDPQALFLATRTEIEAHRARGGDEATELSLLMVFLRLARQLGALKNLESVIERAIWLARDEPLRRLALITLKAEHQQYAGHLRESEASLVEGLELARGVDPTRKSLILIQLGKLLQRQDRYAEARRLFEDLLPAVERVGNRALTAACRYHLGNLFLHEGKTRRALECHRQALDERRSLGLQQHVGPSLTAVAAVHLTEGDYPRAIAVYQEARSHLLQHGSRGESSYALLGLARTHNRLGDPEAAAPLVRESLELRGSLDDQVGEAIARLAMAETNLLLGQLDQALREARRASFRLTVLNMPRYVGDAEQLVGRIQLQLRQPARAATHFESAFSIHRQHGHLRDSTFDRAWLLEAALALDDEEAVSRHCADLAAVMATIRYPESGEVVDLRLFRGLRWLRARGRDLGDPLLPLRRAYQALCAKTEHLDSALRNRFLLRVPDNRAILDFAAELGELRQE
ncbi:MAG TPA: tetratricopeptide repeat protein [Thermoanaerobaculia bacterium]|nr:tetratricopeptide repeat protein [Thermoanaerobaculia bacterium]